MNENLVRREEYKQVNLFPVLKCDSTWFYAKNPVQANTTTADATTVKQNHQKEEVQKMTLFILEEVDCYGIFGYREWGDPK